VNRTTRWWLRDPWYVRAAEHVDAAIPDTWYGRVGIAICAVATGFLLTIVAPTVLGVLLLALVVIDMRRSLERHDEGGHRRKRRHRRTPRHEPGPETTDRTR